MRKNRIVFNKPIYIGFCVLKISKLLMFDSYYNRIQPMFKDVKLTYIDIVSFVLHITDSNIYTYKILKENEDLFDFSNYPKGIKMYVVKKLISFEDYFNCLFYNEVTKYKYKHFKSIDHQILTVESTKSGLTAFDSKRYYLSNIRSIPFRNKIYY